MSANKWPLNGYPLPDGSTLRRAVADGINWEIISAGRDRTALIILPELYHKWVGAGLISADLFERFDVENSHFFICFGSPEHIISSVQSGPYPISAVAALAFAAALRETRKIDSIHSLQDAIYLEQASHLLPTYTETEIGDDQVVLGTWLSGGVHISTASFDRLCNLLNWMPKALVAEIIREAGFPVSGGQYLINTVEHSTELPLKRAADAATEKLVDGNTRFQLPGRPALETFFNEQVVDIIANEEKYKRMGIEFPTAVVLHGPPGCGKTFATEKLVEFLGWPCYSIDSGSIGSSYIHATSKKIAEVFDEAIAHAPSVIMIDEMEAFLADRSMGAASGTHHMEEVAEFLRRIPEASKQHVLVIAMTNMIDAIDPAIIRRGRFDHIVEVKMPSAAEVRALLESLLSKLPVSNDIEIESLSNRLAGRPLSDAAFVVKEAGRLAVKADQDEIDNEIIFKVCDALPLQNEGKRKIGFTS